MRNTCLALILTAAAVPALAAQDTERVSKTMPLGPGGTLHLKSFSGRVTITGTDRQDVSIEAVRRATRDRLDHVKLDIHMDGSNALVINANLEDRAWYEFSRHNNHIVDTDLNIKVPRRLNVDVSVFSAAVAVENVDGSHRVHSFSSKLELANVNGPIDAHTFSGSVDISQSSWGPNQTIDIDTFSGSVRLRLPQSAKGRVSFNSFSGHLDSDIPLTFRNSSHRSVKAELGGTSDGGTLRIKTFSGSARINR